MNLDFEKALTYMFKDPQWLNKLLAGTAVLFCSFAVLMLPIFVFIFTNSLSVTAFSTGLCSIFAFITVFAFTGYVVETANKRINYQNSMLPDWKDFGRFIVSGLKYSIGYFLYVLPLIIAGFVYLFLLSFVMIGYSAHTASHQVIPFFLITILGALLLLFFILVMVFAPLMMCSFFKDLKILSFVNFKEAFNLIKDNVSNYFVLILLFIALSVLMQFLFSILAITIVGIAFIPVAYFYACLISSEICAQFVLSSKDKE